MKNFIQRETLQFPGQDLEGLCRFLATKFVQTYEHVDGVQVSASEVPYSEMEGGLAFSPAGPERASARIELNRAGVVETMAGIRGFRLLRVGGSSFQGFIRDRHTTLPDIANRPLHMWLDLEWHYVEHDASSDAGAVTTRVRTLVRDVFRQFESGSIQQLMFQIGTRLLAEESSVAEVRLEANNRTWDTVAEEGETLGVYTDSRPPYGCLGLSLKRSRHGPTLYTRTRYLPWASRAWRAGRGPSPGRNCPVTRWLTPSPMPRGGPTRRC